MFLLVEGKAPEAPLIVQFLNYYFGEPVYEFQIKYTKPVWDKFLSNFGTDAEAAFGAPYSPENAIPWYTVMFVIACLLTVALIWIFKGRLSEDDPRPGQLTLEAGFLAIKDLVVSVIGEHGFQYFPVVATFAILVLVSNLMGLFPLFMAPTASVNVTFALAITSFIYYNYVGIRENGLVSHIAHLTGPRLPLLMTIIITPLIFSIELISNTIRPFTLGIRLFANMFADEQISSQVANLYPPYTQFLVPIALMPLAVFVAFVQTLVFTLLSMIYISEVSHGGAHDDHHGGEQTRASGEVAAAAHA